jgi:hypothetical protein
MVLASRSGFDRGIPEDLETLGRRFGVTRERIRQIEAKALRKMRHPSRFTKLPALFGFVPPAVPEPNVHTLADDTKVVDIDANIAI